MSPKKSSSTQKKGKGWVSDAAKKAWAGIKSGYNYVSNLNNKAKSLGLTRKVDNYIGVPLRN